MESGSFYKSDYQQCKAVYWLVLIIVIILILTVINILMKNEYFTNYTQSNKQLARSVDVMKDKYPYQDVSQDSIPQQQQDLAKTYIEPTNLAQQYQKIMKPVDLLPQNQEANDWARANPTGSGSLELKNMLEAGQHIGNNTQGSSLKNANLQLRSEPANPILNVSVFNNSSITPDIYRKQLEIGECSA